MNGYNTADPVVLYPVFHCQLKFFHNLSSLLSVIYIHKGKIFNIGLGNVNFGLLYR